MDASQTVREGSVHLILSPHSVTFTRVPIPLADLDDL
jgi:hypothetical protein